jgi:hypothetical protein
MLREFGAQAKWDSGYLRLLGYIRLVLSKGSNARCRAVYEPGDHGVAVGVVEGAGLHAWVKLSGAPV